MHIECPHCKKVNQIEFAENIICTECNKNFKDFKFGKKRFFATSTLLIAGIVGGYSANELLDENRYPLELEYAIIDSCVNASENMHSIEWYKRKREICLCALDRTEQSISYSDYKSNETLFSDSFRQSITECR